MASFTDLSPLPLNPYIQQLPVEDMIDVGLEKQRRYDAGVEKIQSAIDNVAGLDIIKDADKAYLNNLLSNVGDTLKTVAMGDFSNPQLVNSMTGLVGKVGRDKNVQNAVYSTYNIRKQLSTIQDAKTNGKGQYGIENESEYLTKLNSYIASPKAGEKFDASYTPYTDVNKKLLEIAKEVGIDESDVQQLYDTDSQGNIVVDPKTGMPSFNPIMAEKILKGKDASKILSAFQNALTPNDYNQLAITGRYINRNLTPVDLKERILSSYGGTLSAIDTQLQDINLKLFEENSKNKKDDKLISSLNRQKEIFELQRDKIQRSRNEDVSLVDANPDAVRANLYTNTYLTGMSKALSSMTEQTKYSVSPQFTVTMDLNRFNREVQRDRTSDYHWSVEQQQKAEDRAYTQQKDALEMWYKYGVGTPPAGMGQEGLPEPIDLSKGATSVINSVKDEYQTGVQQLNDVNYKLTTRFFKEANPKKAGQTDEEYNRWIADQINKYAQSQQSGIVQGAEAINTFTSRFAGKQLDKWRKDEKSIPYEWRGVMAEQDELTKNLSVQKVKLDAIRNRAIAEAKSKGLDYITFEEIEKKAVPTDITLTENLRIWGTPLTVHLSKEDIINLAQLHPEVFNRLGGLIVDDEQARSREAALKNLVGRWGEGTLSRIVTNVYGYYVSPQELYGKQTSLGKVAHYIPATGAKLSSVENVGKMMRKRDYSKIAEIEAQMYIDAGYVKQPMSYSLKKGKENEDDVNNRLVEVISKYKGGVNEDPSFSTEDMVKAALSGKPNAVKFVVNPGTASRPNVYTMEIFGQSGASRSMVINEDEFTYLTKTAPPKSSNKPRVLDLIDTFGTTGWSGSNDSGNAYFTSKDFKNLKGVDYTVTGNLVPDASSSNLLWFKLFVHTPDGKTTPLTYDTPIPRYNADGTYNKDLDRLPEGINATVIESLKKVNK
jgi:hypothetical protein